MYNILTKHVVLLLNYREKIRNFTLQKIFKIDIILKVNKRMLKSEMKRLPVASAKDK